MYSFYYAVYLFILLFFEIFIGIIVSALRVYHPREPKKSPLWQILNRYYEDFEKSYDERFALSLVS